MGVKLVYNQIKNLIEIESKSGCKLITTEYEFEKSKLETNKTASHVLLQIICECGTEFTTSYTGFKDSNKRKCSMCSSGTKWSYEKVLHFIEVKNNNNCKLLTTQTEFEQEKNKQNKSGFYVKLKIKCSCGNEFSQSISGFKNNNKCQLCTDSQKRSRKRLSLNVVKDKFKLYSVEYVDGEYKNHDSKVSVKCACGSVFETTLRAAKNSYNSNGKNITCEVCRKEYLNDLFKLSFEDKKRV